MITSCYVLMNELPGANFPGKSAGVNTYHNIQETIVPEGTQRGRSLIISPEGDVIATSLQYQSEIIDAST